MIHLFPPPTQRRGHRCGRRIDFTPSPALCKAAAAVAVEEGHISPTQACGLCDMDPQELEVWQVVVQDRGLRRMLAGRI